MVILTPRGPQKVEGKRAVVSQRSDVFLRQFKAFSQVDEEMSFDVPANVQTVLELSAERTRLRKGKEKGSAFSSGARKAGPGEPPPPDPLLGGMRLGQNLDADGEFKQPDEAKRGRRPSMYEKYQTSSASNTITTVSVSDLQFDGAISPTSPRGVMDRDRGEPSLSPDSLELNDDKSDLVESYHEGGGNDQGPSGNDVAVVSVVTLHNDTVVWAGDGLGESSGNFSKIGKAMAADFPYLANQVPGRRKVFGVDVPPTAASTQPFQTGSRLGLPSPLSENSLRRLAFSRSASSGEIETSPAVPQALKRLLPGEAEAALNETEGPMDTIPEAILRRLAFSRTMSSDDSDASSLALDDGNNSEVTFSCRSLARLAFAKSLSSVDTGLSPVPPRGGNQYFSGGSDTALSDVEEGQSRVPADILRRLAFARPLSSGESGISPRTAAARGNFSSSGSGFSLSDVEEMESVDRTDAGSPVNRGTGNSASAPSVSCSVTGEETDPEGKSMCYSSPSDFVDDFDDAYVTETEPFPHLDSYSHHGDEQPGSLSEVEIDQPYTRSGLQAVDKDSKITGKYGVPATPSVTLEKILASCTPGRSGGLNDRSIPNKATEPCIVLVEKNGLEMMYCSSPSTVLGDDLDDVDGLSPSSSMPCSLPTVMAEK